MIEIEAPIGLEGVVVHRVIGPDGVRVAHVQRNHLTDDGLSSLQSSPLTDVLNTLVVGHLQVASDTDSPMPEWWNPVDPGVNPEYQDRNMQGWSTDDGGFPDIVELDPVNAEFWSFERTRVIDFQDFPKENNRAGVGDLDDVRDISAFAFCDQALVQSLSQGGQDYKEYQLSQLFVSQVFEDGQGAAVHYGFPGNDEPESRAPADIVLGTQDVLAVTYLLKLYPPITPVQQTVPIGGVSTTVRTRAYQLSDPETWGSQGVARYFGRWQTDGQAAGVGESNQMPGINAGVASGWGEAVAGGSKGSGGVGFQDVTYRVEPSGALDPAGIGHLLHGRWSPEAFSARRAFITTFDPPIQKTDLERVEFNVRYTWGRR